MLENCDKIMYLTYQNLSGCALFCHNSLAKVNTHEGQMSSEVKLQDWFKM